MIDVLIVLGAVVEDAKDCYCTIFLLSSQKNARFYLFIDHR